MFSISTTIENREIVAFADINDNGRLFIDGKWILSYDYSNDEHFKFLKKIGWQQTPQDHWTRCKSGSFKGKPQVLGSAYCTIDFDKLENPKYSKVDFYHLLKQHKSKINDFLKLFITNDLQKFQ